MKLNDVWREIRSSGLGPAIAAIRYGRYRDRMDRSYLASTLLAPVPQPPGRCVEARQIPNGVLFTFEHADLEVVFLAPDLVRLTWGPGILPPPYALARLAWPEVALRHSLARSGLHSLSTAGLTLQIAENGQVNFLNPSEQSLRVDFPPERLGNAWRQSSQLDAGQQIFGLGERAAPLARRGRSYRMWNSDPGGSYAPGKDPLYMGIPVYMLLGQQGGYLVFYENSFPATFQLDPSEASGEVCVEFAGGSLRYYFIPGNPAQALERYTELTGRAPLPPRWALGFHQSRWGYQSAGEIREVLQGFQEHDLPLSAIHLDIDYMDGYRIFTFDLQDFPDMPALTGQLEQAGVKTVAIIDPGVKIDPDYFLYHQGRDQGHFCTDTRGSVVHGVVWPGASVFPDFTSPKTRQWWGSQYKTLLEAGITGFWHDMNEPAAFSAWGDMTLPLGTQHDLDGQGGDHHQAHNLYGLLMNRAGFEGLRQLRPDRRPWLLTRSGWAGVQRYAWNWTGDCQTSWESLRMTLPAVLSLGLSGIPFTGPDIGGFSGDPSAELFLRWFQMAAFMPFFRTHSAWGTSRREPWVFGESTTRILQKFLRLRYRLLPYLYSLAWESSQNGAPLVRPLFWDHPERRELWAVEDAFMLGSELLVAPVMEPGILEREVVLPPGGWYSFWEQPPDESSFWEGDQTVKVPCDQEHIPVLARAGTILPLSNAHTLELHVYPPKPGKPLSNLTLFSDAGDGYGISRLDRFNGQRTPTALELRWDKPGDVESFFPFPYTQVAVVLHGMRFRRAWVDDQPLDLTPTTADEVTIRLNSFKTLNLESRDLS